MTSAERRASAGLAGIFALRMLGLFLILPVFAIQAREIPGATPLLIGIAIGAYGLTQALLQIPFGMLSDRIGRKPVILGGLIIFVIGSVVAALADDIYGVIIGRLLQGSGAIAAAVMALTADLTREAVRTRAMAGIGISIALSFALALVLGPIVAHWGGLEGLFWFIAVLACAGILILLLVVPNPSHSSLHRDAEPVASQFRGVLADGELRRLDLGIFTLHLTMTSLFLVAPLFMQAQGLAPVDHWQVYLPVLLLSIVAMIPLIIQAEGKGRMKLVLLGTLVALVLGLLGLNFLGHGILAIAFWLFILITIFNLLEAILPSMVSQGRPGGGQGHGHGGLFHLSVRRGLSRRPGGRLDSSVLGGGGGPDLLRPGRPGLVPGRLPHASPPPGCAPHDPRRRAVRRSPAQGPVAGASPAWRRPSSWPRRGSLTSRWTSGKSIGQDCRNLRRRGKAVSGR